jgi:hypothetical protein
MTKTTSTLFLATLLALGLALPAAAEEAEQAEQTCNALFVHNAKDVSLVGDTLTMKGASPSVTFFCDRPVRFAGHLGVQEWLDSVSKGKDSFAEDPPNAALSILAGDQMLDVIVTLRNKPTVDGDTLVYTGVEIIDGEAPSTAGAGSLFIDVIGRPMSPGSVAGVHRRHRRRAMRRCAAGVTCY